MTLHAFGHTGWYPPRRSRRRRALLAVFWLAIAIVYVLSAAEHKERVNLSAAAAGQYPYLVYAQGMAQQGVSRFVGDRNRMPLFPALLTAVHSEHWESFFNRACWLAIVSSMVVLIGVGLIAYRILPDWPATALTLSAVVCVFIQKASFVGAELLYYGFLFASWLLICRLILRPQLKWAVWVGVALGLTHLTKASALLTVLVFVGVMIVYAAVVVVRDGGVAGALSRGEIRSKLRHILECLTVALLVLFVLVFPYIKTSRDRFGSYFYNVNSRFFMWCDSWSQAKAFADRYHIEERPPDASPSDIPGPVNYWRTHSGSQVFGRLGHGLWTLGQLALEGLYLKYVLVAGLLCLVVGLRQRHRLGEVSLELWIVVLFCALFFGLQVLCYAWYAQVAHGDRFLISLFLPGFFALLWLGHRLSLATSGVPFRGRRVRKSDVLAVGLTLFLCCEGAALATISLYRPTETFVRFYFNESHELLEDGKLDDAARGFQGVIKLEPSFAPAHRDLGMALLWSGRYDDAIASLSEAARLRPLDADLRNSLGSACLQAGRIEDAIREFKQAIQLDPGRPVVWYNLGVSHHRRGDDAEARAVLERLNGLDIEWGRKLSAVLRE